MALQATRDLVQMILVCCTFRVFEKRSLIEEVKRSFTKGLKGSRDCANVHHAELFVYVGLYANRDWFVG